MKLPNQVKKRVGEKHRDNLGPNGHHNILRLILLFLRFIWPKVLPPTTSKIMKRRKSILWEEAVASNL